MAPAIDSVHITVSNGIVNLNVNATVGSDGTFSAILPTATLAVGVYPVTYSFDGDANFNKASGTGTLSITYGIVVLSDLSKANNAGSTIPIKIELTTARGEDVSSASIPVTALGIEMVPVYDPGSIIPVQAAGNSSPDNVFQSLAGTNSFDQYNLKTAKKLTPGTYWLFFTVQGDPIIHAVQFLVK